MVTKFEFSDGNWTFDPTVPARVAAGIQERITSRASRMNDDEQGDGFHYLEDAQDESDEWSELRYVTGTAAWEPSTGITTLSDLAGTVVRSLIEYFNYEVDNDMNDTGDGEVNEEDIIDGVRAACECDAQSYVTSTQLMLF